MCHCSWGRYWANCGCILSNQQHWARDREWAWLGVGNTLVMAEKRYGDNYLHYLRFIEAELEDAKGRLLCRSRRVSYQRNSWGKQRKKAEAVRKSMDLEALCQQRKENGWGFFSRSHSILIIFTQPLIAQHNNWNATLACAIGLIKFIMSHALTTSTQSLFDVLEAEPRKRSNTFGQKERPRPQIKQRSSDLPGPKCKELSQGGSAQILPAGEWS